MLARCARAASTCAQSASMANRSRCFATDFIVVVAEYALPPSDVARVYRRNLLQLFQLLANLVGNLGVARQFQIVRIRVASRFVVLQLFLGLAQAQPCLRLAAIPLGGFLEAARGSAVTALLEVIVPGADFLLCLERVEAVHRHGD